MFQSVTINLKNCVSEFYIQRIADSLKTLRFRFTDSLKQCVPVKTVQLRALQSDTESLKTELFTALQPVSERYSELKTSVFQTFTVSLKTVRTRLLQRARKVLFIALQRVFRVLQRAQINVFP